MPSLTYTSLDRQFDAVLKRREVMIPALRALAEEMPPGRSRGEIRKLVSLLERSRTTSDLSHSPTALEWLPLLATGFTDDSSTRRLSELMANASRESQNRSRRRRVLAYPLAVLLIAMAVFTFLCVIVVPTFGNMFEEFGMILPMPTRIVLFFTDQMLNHPLRFVITLAAIAATLYGAVRLWTHFALTTRLMGSFVAGNSASVSAMSTLTGQLAELLSVDVSLPDALWIAGHSCQHYHFKKVMEHLARWAHQATRPLRESPDARFLPANVIDALEPVHHDQPDLALLRELSALYSERAARRVDWASGAAGQFAMVVIGLVVAFVVIAMFSPLLVLVTGLS